MSDQSQVNSYFNQYILYYCNSVNSDSTVYNQDLSNVCTVSFNEDSTLNISDWLIGSYIAPTNSQLLEYTSENVLTFFNDFYTIPLMIQDKMPYMISSEELKNIRADDSMLGYVVYDTNAKSMKYWNGLSWEAAILTLNNNKIYIEDGDYSILEVKK